MNFYGLGSVEKTFAIRPPQETTFRRVMVNIQLIKTRSTQVFENYRRIVAYIVSPQTRLRRNTLGSVRLRPHVSGNL